MSYSKTNWQNLPNTTTPITAASLNKMEEGIADANGAIGADAYSSSRTYAVNDFCIYNNTLYICTTAIITAEAFNAAHWKATALKDHIIIERGSNANGDYVKFGDGTMICTYTATVTDLAIDESYGSIYIGYKVWTFPAQFIELPIADCNIRWGAGASWSSVAITTASTARLCVYDITSRASGTNVFIRAKAIGRWK